LFKAQLPCHSPDIRSSRLLASSLSSLSFRFFGQVISRGTKDWRLANGDGRQGTGARSQGGQLQGSGRWVGGIVRASLCAKRYFLLAGFKQIIRNPYEVPPALHLSVHECIKNMCQTFRALINVLNILSTLRCSWYFFNLLKFPSNDFQKYFQSKWTCVRNKEI